LRLETATPTETDKAITTLEQENKELKDQIENLETTMQKIYQKVFHEKIELEEQKKNQKNKKITPILGLGLNFNPL